MFYSRYKIFRVLALFFRFRCSLCFLKKVVFFASCTVIFEVSYTFTLFYAFLERKYFEQVVIC